MIRQSRAGFDQQARRAAAAAVLSGVFPLAVRGSDRTAGGLSTSIPEAAANQPSSPMSLVNIEQLPSLGSGPMSILLSHEGALAFWPAAPIPKVLRRRRRPGHERLASVLRSQSERAHDGESGNRDGDDLGLRLRAPDRGSALEALLQNELLLGGGLFWSLLHSSRARPGDRFSRPMGRWIRRVRPPGASSRRQPLTFRTKTFAMLPSSTAGSNTAPGTRWSTVFSPTTLEATRLSMSPTSVTTTLRRRSRPPGFRATTAWRETPSAMELSRLDSASPSTCCRNSGRRSAVHFTGGSEPKP